MKIFAILIALVLFQQAPNGQAAFETKVCDLGTIRSSDGPVSSEFVLVNASAESVYINSVVSSCGCTGVEWTRTAIPSGGKGTVRVTYSNDEGPQSFDKTLTVFLSSSKRPVVLHLRGVVRK